jgi:hypothetical protein
MATKVRPQTVRDRKGRSLQGLAMHKKRKAMDRGREMKEQRTGDEGTADGKQEQSTGEVK